MRLAGGLGLGCGNIATDAHTDSFGQDWEVPSERESRRIALTPAGSTVQVGAALQTALLTLDLGHWASQGRGGARKHE